MDSSSVKNTIKALLAQDYAAETNIYHIVDDDDDLFVGGPALSSFTVMGLLVKMEREFNIVIDDDDLKVDNLRSINALGALVCKYVDEQQTKTQVGDTIAAGQGVS